MMRTFIFFLFVCIQASEAACQTSSKDNIVSESITFKEVRNDLTVYGIFEGRSPCDQISKQLGANLQNCDHLKWQLILFRDAITGKPTTYKLTTEMFREPLTGKWKISKEKNADPDAVIYTLENASKNKPLYLLKGDENVLFVLDENLEFMTGDQDFSYTLNRVRKVLKLNTQ